MNKESFKNIVVFLISIFLSVCFFLVVLNLIARYENYYNDQYYTNLDWDGKDVNDIPNKRIPHSTLGSIVGRNEKYIVKINTHGLRDYEYPLNRQKEIRRIIVLGDSVTFGCGVNLEDSYVKQLERLINQGPYGKTEVINFGAPGASTFNELELFEKKVILYSPDILILQMDPNDSIIINQIKKNDPFLNKIILHLKENKDNISQWLKCKLELYKYYRYKKQPPDEYSTIIVPLKEIIGGCKRLNIKLAIIGYDYYHNNSTMERAYEKVLEYIRENNIPLLDLSKTEFGKLPYKDKYVNPDLNKYRVPIDNHPNKYGSRVIAEEVLRFLKSLPGFLE